MLSFGTDIGPQLCRHAVSVCLSVSFVYSVETNKRIFKIYSPSGSHTILVCRYQTLWQFRRGTPNFGKKLRFSTISGFGYRSRRVSSTFRRSSIGCSTYASFVSSPAINKRRRATHQWTLFMTERLYDAEDNITEFNCIRTAFTKNLAIANRTRPAA